MAVDRPGQLKQPLLRLPTALHCSMLLRHAYWCIAAGAHATQQPHKGSPANARPVCPPCLNWPLMLSCSSQCLLQQLHKNINLIKQSLICVVSGLGDKLTGYKDIKDFVMSLEKPR